MKQELDKRYCRISFFKLTLLNSRIIKGIIFILLAAVQKEVSL